MKNDRWHASHLALAPVDGKVESMDLDNNDESHQPVPSFKFELISVREFAFFFFAEPPGFARRS